MNDPQTDSPESSESFLVLEYIGPDAKTRTGDQWQEGDAVRIYGHGDWEVHGRVSIVTFDGRLQNIVSHEPQPLRVEIAPPVAFAIVRGLPIGGVWISGPRGSLPKPQGLPSGADLKPLYDAEMRGQPPIVGEALAGEASLSSLTQSLRNPRLLADADVVDLVVVADLAERIIGGLLRRDVPVPAWVTEGLGRINQRIIALAQGQAMRELLSMQRDLEALVGAEDRRELLTAQIAVTKKMLAKLRGEEDKEDGEAEAGGGRMPAPKDQDEDEDDEEPSDTDRNNNF